MEVQVCLGRIEAWAMDSYDNIHYLESIFNVKLLRPGDEEPLMWKCVCPQGTHPDSLICGSCNTKLARHGRQFGGGDGLKCPGLNANYSDFHCKRFQVMKKCTNNVPGNIVTTFNISSTDDRRRLHKLLEFMSI